MIFTEPIIRLDNVGKVFETGEKPVRALSRISFSIEKGEIFGVIGLSGAGKSTLVRCINLLETPTEGRVFVNGLDMLSLSPAELRRARRDIGMIFQGFHLLMQKNVLDNVCFPLLLSGVPKSDAVEKARKLLATVGLSDKEKAFPAQLSGGQKQRVAIARALSTDPKVLLCDEATSALDPTTTKSILDLLQQLNRELNVTVVVITHEMRVIEQICSRVAILADSEVAELGAVEEIFRHPKTEAARKLIMPKNDDEDIDLPESGHLLRLIFNGTETYRPLLASMVLSCGCPVSIVFANTRPIHGKIFGQMVLHLPEDGSADEKVKAFLREQNMQFEEVKRWV